jgi:hypothetical protein
MKHSESKSHMHGPRAGSGSHRTLAGRGHGGVAGKHNADFNQPFSNSHMLKGTGYGKRQLAIASEPAKCTKMIEFCTFFWLFCTKLFKMQKKPRISARFLVIIRA